MVEAASVSRISGYAALHNNGAGISIIVCLVLFLMDFWFAVVTGRLMMIGIGALPLVIAGVCAMACWPVDVRERHDLLRGMNRRR
jgi:hypothetical protein